MKKLSLPILAFALLGVVSLFVPGPTGSLFRIWGELDGAKLTLLVLSLGGAGAAAALATRHERPWHGYVALAGFSLALVKVRAWTVLSGASAAPMSLWLLAFALVGGVICALVATVRGGVRSAAATS